MDGEIRAGDVVLLNTGDKLRLSVKDIDGSKVTCQWVVGDTIRKDTFHVAQLVHAIDHVSERELDMSLIRETIALGVDNFADAINELSIDELRKLEEYATKLRLATIGAMERKGV